MFFILILLIAAAFVALVLAVKIKIVVRAAQCRIEATLVLLGFIRLRRRFCLQRDKNSLARLVWEKKNGKEESVVTLAGLICRLDKKKRTPVEYARDKALGYIFAKAHIDVRAQAKIGLGDAFATAMVCGALQTASGVVRSFGKQKSIRLLVRPFFSGKIFRIHADCIITLSPVNIMTGYIIYRKKRRR